MENISKKLKKNVVQCNAWVLDKLDATPVSQQESEYARKDGSTIQTVDVEYDNGDTFQVSESRFWKRK